MFWVTVCIFMAVFTASLAFFAHQDKPVAERLRQFAQFNPAQGMDLSRPLWERALLPIVSSLVGVMAHLTPEKVVLQTQQRLERAGKPGGLGVRGFVGLRLLALVGLPGGYGGLLLLRGQPPTLVHLVLLALLILLGWLLPDLWLSRLVERRQQEIQQRLPDTLDLLVVCIEAGLALDAALARVVERTTGPLAEELRRVQQEARLGRRRRDALHDMAQRTGVSEVVSLMAALIQADQTGASIGRVLRVQADQLRIRRRQRAEESAMKTPLKILFPLLFCIFPATFIIILGPAVMAIGEAFFP
ncbi:MAG: type II secretion system F family protein [Chloroflexi bacterium]|nr:type II secretion system F family protein [Chloroflexota bacterium]